MTANKNTEKDTLVAIGEALIDFIPNKTGCDFDEVGAFSPAIGGAPANVCGAFAALGGKARIITQLGDDPFGHKIERALKRKNVDVSAISFTDKANTALAFVSLAADGNRTFSFYRKPSADMLLSPDNVSAIQLENAYALCFCSVSLGDFPMKRAHEKAIELARSGGAIISFDPNIRLPLWENKRALYDVIHRFMPMSDILKISDEELTFITGENDIEKALPKLFVGNVKLVIYTCGKNGAYAFTKKAKAFSKSIEVSATDTTGAGDGFIGSFLYRLKALGITSEALADTAPEILGDCLAFSSRFCSISVCRNGAIDSYPTLSETLNMKG